MVRSMSEFYQKILQSIEHSTGYFQSMKQSSHHCPELFEFYCYYKRVRVPLSPSFWKICVLPVVMHQVRRKVMIPKTVF
jgi:hypothetical protein